MRKLASIRRIGEVRAIEGADAIEAVQIDGWQCVAKKGEFKAGDLCCYFEIDSFLPTTNPAFEFMAVRGATKDAEGSAYSPRFTFTNCPLVTSRSTFLYTPA